MCFASSEICVVRNACASSVGAAIANGSSSTVTRSSPRKNSEKPNIMKSRSSCVIRSGSAHWRASSVKSKSSVDQCWRCQRMNSFS